MNISKSLILKILMLTAIITVTLTIFFNSFKDIVASNKASDVVVDVIVSDQSNEEIDYLKLIVRKTAHLVEYAALGVVVMLYVKFIEKERQKKFYGAALFYTLLVAVVDEHIQSFSNRTSSTGDILLDFLGVLIGFTLVLAIHFIYVKLKKRKKCS